MEMLNRRGRAHDKWWKSHAEKHQTEFITVHSRAQATAHTAHKEYPESIIDVDLKQQDEYKETSKDKQIVTQPVWTYVKSKIRYVTGMASLCNNGVLVSDTTLNQQNVSVIRT